MSWSGVRTEVTYLVKFSYFQITDLFIILACDHPDFYTDLDCNHDGFSLVAFRDYVRDNNELHVKCYAC